MSDDLIDQLRRQAFGWCQQMCNEAADEIERLKAIVDAIPDKDDPLGWVHRVAAMMDQPHVLKLGADGWSIEHPIGCRLDGHTLHECPHHIAVAEHVDFVLDEWGEGVYRIWLDDTIWCGFDGTPA